MTFRRPRVTGGSYSQQMGDVILRTAAQYRGRAIGGPLDMVILTADLNWHGRIRDVNHKNSASTYPGHYGWNGQTWIWLED